MSAPSPARRVADAWNVPGPAAWLHHDAQARLLREWPTLALAVRDLAAEPTPETFLSFGCDLDGHPQNHTHQCTGRPALTPEQLADGWARRNAADPEHDTDIARRDENVAAVLRFMVARGYVITHPAGTS